MNCYVFAYGTLREAKVRKEVLGYETTSGPATLKGFRMSSIHIGNFCYPILIEDDLVDSEIEGEYFEIYEGDLAKLDSYETNAYHRKIVRLNNNVEAWVYFGVCL